MDTILPQINLGDNSKMFTPIPIKTNGIDN